MKINKLINILLVFMLGFSLAHSLVLEEQSEHTYVQECVSELCHQSHFEPEHDYCLDCECHTPYILASNTACFTSKKISLAPSFNTKLYTHYQISKLIKPPIA